MCSIVVVTSLDFRRSLESGVILVPRASVSFGHVVNDILRRVALGTRMTYDGPAFIREEPSFYVTDIFTTALPAVHEITTHFRFVHKVVVSFM